MPTPKVDPRENLRRVQAYLDAVEDGHAPMGTVASAGQLSAVQMAAQRIGVPGQTIRDAIRREGLDAPPDEPVQAPFIAPSLPSADEPIEDIIARKRSLASRKIEADAARKLVPVKITMPGPIGLFVMGDPHLDNDGCDFAAIERDIEAVARQPRVLGINAGDVTDNWVGRLEKLYSQSSVTARDGWRLAEWLFDQPVNWLALVGGNHDAWSNHRDPLRWITKGRVPVYENSAARFALQHPNGAETRVHVRHDFPGRSMYSDLHGMKRELREGWRDHILVAGHIHVGEDSGCINGDGNVSQLVRLSGYKRIDSFAKDLGFKSRPLHPSALIIINPDASDMDRGRAWLAPSVPEGVDYLNWLAAR
jgi:hypothetical protein